MNLDDLEPKLPEYVEAIHSEALKLKIPIVDPIHNVEDYNKENLLRYLPYYILVYGQNIERLAPLVNDFRLKWAFIGIAKLLRGLAKYYHIKE